jgi:D-alanyl-D-alanine carboxypeptidase (penicillin-binding protein 5/6)
MTTGSPMPDRRLLLGLAGAALLPAPALAQRQQAPRQAPPQRPAPPPATPAQTPIGPVDTLARNAILVDANTGAVLLEKAPDERVPPASMSKLMTMYVVFERLREGTLRLDQELTVSERARAMGGSRMFLELGSRVSVENLVRGVIIQSGNDACVVLAEAIGGSEERFADIMNEVARRIGLRDSTFRNASGWPHPEHRMTARDLAVLARRLIADFPEYYRLYSERSFRWNGIEQQNRNPLLGRFAGADGLKTGSTEEAGYNLTASALRDGRRLILVVTGLPSMRARAEESERLLEWGFREFDNVTLFRAADTVDEAPVWLGARRSVPLVGGRDVVLTLPRNWRDRLAVRVAYPSPVRAPVLRGQEIGELMVGGTGVPPMRVPLYAGADVERLGLIERIPAVVMQRLFGG